MTQRLQTGGLSNAEAEEQARLTSFGFEPGDIVSKVMSFGSLAPIGVRVIGTDLTLVREHAEKIAAEMRHIPYLRDIQFEQTLDYPTLEVTIDREKAGLSGAEVADVKHALVMATSSTRFTNLNYWVDVKTGFDYLVQVQVPVKRIDKPEVLPLESVNPLVNLMLRDVATVKRGVRPGEYDRNMSQRYLTVTANVEGEDMGRARARCRRPSRLPARRPRECGCSPWASCRR
jgi:Cu/Ag efflux pump CusA